MNILSAINPALFFVCFNQLSCQSQNLSGKQVLNFFTDYSIQFEPKSIGLEKALSDSAKVVLSQVDLNNKILITELEPSIEKILLKQLLYQFKIANMDYDFYHAGYPNANKVLFCFCLNNDIDTNNIHQNQLHGNLGYLGSRLYDIIKEKYVSKNDNKEIKLLLSQISDKVTRITGKK